MTDQFRHTGRGLGLESLEIRQMLSGNPGESPVVLAPAPVAGVLTLAEARITLGNLAEGSTPQVRVNSGPWTALQPDAGGDASLPRLRQGANTAVFRQVAANGTPSAAESITIRFDSIAPPQPLVALHRPGAGGVTNDPMLRIGRIETDAQIQYSVNGAAWSNVYAPADGPTIVRLRAVDDAGNTSRPSAPVRFTLDRVAAAPAVALVKDTGVNDDQVTTDGRLRVTGIEPGARAQYSTDEGRSWKGTFQPTFGLNEVLVRQRDRAGNYSDATDFSFTKVFASGTLDLKQVRLYVNNLTHPAFAASGKVGIMRAGPESVGQRWFLIDPDSSGRGTVGMVPLVHAEETTEGDLRKGFVFLVGPQLDTEGPSPENFGLIQFTAGFRSDNTFVLREKYKGTGDMTVGQTKEFDYEWTDEKFRIRFDGVRFTTDGAPFVMLTVKGFM